MRNHVKSSTFLLLFSLLIVSRTIINAKDITNRSKGKQNKELFLKLRKKKKEKRNLLKFFLRSQNIFCRFFVPFRAALNST